MTSVVETRDLTMRFGGVVAVDNVTFSLGERELRCLIGPNGAGKSSFFRCLTGRRDQGRTTGQVLIRGQDVAHWRAHQIVQLGVGIKTQVPSLMNGLTVEENVWLAARRVHGFAGAADLVQEVMTELHIAEIARRIVGELAHGQRQLVEIAVVIVQRPWLVLLDEPAAGMTGEEIERLVGVIRRINQTAAVIVVDHDMAFVRMLASNVTVFHRGAILVDGSAERVLDDARVREVYLGNRAR
jgi:branched-chain amino acid transport system ATP-binding protein/urea transport system ATP-binding protein